MKVLLKTAAAATLLTLTGLAQADMYLGAGVYSTSIDASGLNDDSDVAPALFFGWRPIESVGVELGYYDLGSYDNVDVSALSLAGLLTMEVGPVGVYGKLGVADSTAKAGSIEDGSTDPFGGIGVSADLMDKLYVYGEYLMFSVEDADVDVLGAGIRYAF